MPQTLPTLSLQSYNAAAIAPHVATVRWTYTVPAARFAVVEFLHVSLTRQTAAAPVGEAIAAIGIIPSGGALSRILQVVIFTNAVGDKDHAEWGGRILLAAGDALEGRTIDTSTGGTFRYLVSARISEYVL